MRKMHVLVITPWYPNDTNVQLGTFIKDQAHAISLKHLVSVIVCVPNLELNKRYIIHNAGNGSLQEFILYFKPYKFKILNRIFHFIYYYKLAQMASHKSGKPDIVHLQVMYRMVLIAWILKLIYRAPLIITEHWHGFIDGTFEKENWLFKQSIKKVMERAAIITTVSSRLKEALAKYVNDKKIQIIPNVCKIGLQRNNLFSNEKINALVVADLDNRIKNVSAVIDAVVKLHHSGQSKNFCLTILGDGLDRMMLENLAKELIAVGVVRFIGMQSHEVTLDYIASCNFLIINSHVETFSLVTLEAIRSGVPVLATRCGGPEQFITPKNGVLIDKNNPSELYNAMITMISDYRNYDKDAIKLSVNNVYSPLAICMEFDRIYRP